MNEHQTNGNDTHILYYSPNGFRKAPNESMNRAALFGDGMFETMVFTDGSIRFAKEHGERLKTGAKALHITLSGLSTEDIEEFVRQHFPEKTDLRIRWTVFRSGLGKYTPLTHEASDLIHIQDLDRPLKVKRKAYVSKTITIYPSPWSHCKTLNALPYVMANVERKERDMDEVILLDDQGFVSEAGSANVFWVKENVFYTPSLTCNCIAGVGRRKIIEALDNSGIPVIEGQFSTKELSEAEQVFTSNVTGVAYLAKLEDWSYKTTPIPVVERVFV